MHLLLRLAMGMGIGISVIRIRSSVQLSQTSAIVAALQTEHSYTLV